MTQAVQHEDAVSAVRTFSENFNAAMDHGKWMALVFAVKEGGTVEMHRTTFDFPTDKFDIAIEMMQRNLDRERGGCKPSLLPLAPHVGDNGMDTQNIKVHEESQDLLPDEGPLSQGEMTGGIE